MLEPVKRKAPTQALGARRPAAEFNLSAEERALLEDRDWVTGDEADLIIAQRRLREGGKPIPAEEVLKRFGYRYEKGRVSRAR